MATVVNEVVDSLVEVLLKEKDDFLKVKETLTRIGVASKKNNTLYQSCHILHKRGKYYIVHFKELFMLDGKHSNMEEDDLARRNKIVSLLDEWGLVDVVDPSKIEGMEAPISRIKVVSFKDKEQWNLVPKYNIGGKPKTSHTE